MTEQKSTSHFISNGEVFSLTVTYKVFFFLLYVTSLLHPLTMQRDTLNGIILDVTNDSPIQGSVIKLSGNNLYTITDSNGIFALPVPTNTSIELEVSHVAFKSLRVNFNLSDSLRKNVIIDLSPITFSTETIVVSGKHINSTHEDLMAFTEVLRGKELERSLGSTLASTLKNETGLAMRSMGPAPSRPVIRGMGGDRVVILADGFTSVDLSATSPDHAVSLDPFTIERIEVLRGPRTLLYSPVTFGGIINAIRNEISDEYPSFISGTIGFYGESANHGALGAGILKIPIDNFMGRFEFSRRSAGNLTTPVKVLMNSAMALSNLSTSLSYRFPAGYTGLAIRNFDLNYGIPGGFSGAHPNGVHINLFKREYTGLLSLNLPSNIFPQLTVKISRNYFAQQELESNGLTGAEFGIFQYTGHAELSTNNMGPFESGTFGVNLDRRDFSIGGFVFTPPTISTTFAVFSYQNFKVGSTLFEAGLRYSYGEFNPRKSTESFNTRFIQNRKYHLISAAISVLKKVNREVSIGLNISRSTRLPTIEELYSAGPHLAAYSYETGNPELELELGYGGELFSAYENGPLQLHSNIFYNSFSNYIIPRNSGKTNFATLLPIFETIGVQARFFGAEVEAEYIFNDILTLSNSSSFTSGEFYDGRPLPSIPPFKNITTLSAKIENLLIGFQTELVSSQKKTDIFEQMTSGYGSSNVFIQFTLFNGIFIHNMSLNAENIFNKEYRNHLSRLKIILPEAGINLRLVYRLYF